MTKIKFKKLALDLRNYILTIFYGVVEGFN